MTESNSAAWNVALAGLAGWVLTGCGVGVMLLIESAGGPPACTSFAGIEYLFAAVAIFAIGGGTSGLLGIVATVLGLMELCSGTLACPPKATAGTALGLLTALPAVVVAAILAVNL